MTAPMWRVVGHGDRCEECGSRDVVVALADDAGGLHGLCDRCFTVAVEAGVAMARRANGASGAS